ncbi:dienelactone hydrolase family protein [Geobacter argillaceus]|uniref:Dienelactone hydrolase n=1 Tax=Geobacter argillaceus TaxID=345631 RepID=A0A562VL74_9BACT|nr:dienelactone hydrolase family protein [Geobacter argillaceus]TWJ18716.1 dienelactone hydrolase [Geobacter argillaceus]
MKNAIIALCALLTMGGVAEAKVVTKVVEYHQGNAVLEGYLAYDDSKAGKRPGVLVVHEWTGLGTYVQKRVQQLAGIGYVAFGADIYGKGIRPDNPKDAAAIAGTYKADRQLMRDRVLAGLAELRRQPQVDTGRLAAIGYCFGGTTVLELARSGADVRGVVSFHGGLDTTMPAPAMQVRAKVLVLHGADDPFESPAQVATFQDEMRKAGADWQMVCYGGAVHSFTNPEAGNDPKKGVAYNERADRRSWEAMKLFFAELFGK